MIIALTGTPCTGKSTVCRLLENQFRIIDLNRLVIEEGLHLGLDEKRGSLIADLDALQAKINTIQKNENARVIIEGHISHHLTGYDAVIVLRTHPDVLAQRLANRAYDPEKIRENTEAEALDVILIEALERNEKVYEVETTTSTPDQTSLEIQSIIKHLETGDLGQLDIYLPGRFDWSEVF